MRKLTTLWGMQTCIGGLPGNKTTCSVRVKILRKRKKHKGLKGVDNEQENIFSKSRLKIYLSARARYIAEFGEVCALCSHPTSADLQAIAHLFMNNSDIRNRFVCGWIFGQFGRPIYYSGTEPVALCPDFCCLISFELYFWFCCRPIFSTCIGGRWVSKPIML